jgi:site-specific DNA recombinase
MKYLIYTRVSPKGSSWTGGETTVTDQAAQCRAFVLATDPEGEVLGVVTDEFESGGSSKRPGWMQIIADVKSGSATWDALVVRHLDRFSRSISDAVNALELFHANGKHLLATAQGLNSSTPSGRGVINILLSIAQMEREFCAERTRMKMNSIAAKGLWPVGVLPYGYKRAGKRDNRLIPDPEKAEHVREIFLRSAGGTGPRELARSYGLATNTVLYILRNRIYLGRLPYAGQEHKGQHEPLISPDLFASCQRIIPEHGHAPRPSMQKYPYLLTGLITCDCGRAMTPASAHGRTQRYHYYQCTDRETCCSRTSAPELETEVLAILRSIRLEEADIDRIVDSIRLAAEKRRTAQPEAPDLRRALTRAKSKKERLTRMFIDGLITADNADLMNKELAQATAETNRLTGQLAAAESCCGPSKEVEEEIIGFALRLKNISKLIDAAEGNPKDQRQLITTYVKGIHRSANRWELTVNLPGSSNVPEWRPKPILDEPMMLFETERFTVFGVAA